MVHISRGALAAIAILFTSLSGTVFADTMDCKDVKATNSNNDEPRESKPPAVTTEQPKATESGEAQRDEDLPNVYHVSTVSDVTLEQWEAFASKPPLKGKEGYMLGPFKHTPWISVQYMDLTEKEAIEIRKSPLIRFANAIGDSTGLFDEIDGSMHAVPRDDLHPPPIRRSALHQSLNQRDDSQYHLMMIAAKNQKNDPAKLPDYVFEPTLGQGQIIYVLDSGYRKDHAEFTTRGRTIREFVVPNVLTLGTINPKIPDDYMAPEDSNDHTGHGTMVASIAAGDSFGVASLANLVVVKFKNAAKNPMNPNSDKFLPRGVTDTALEVAWRWIIDDVADQRSKQGSDPNAKFIVNMSYGWMKESEQGKKKIGILESMLQECKAMDITVVLAAGNEGPSKTLDAFIPQRLGSDPRFNFITVGGVNREGKYYDRTTNKHGNRGGEIDLYAGAVDVTAAAHQGKISDSKTDSGTSFAAPAVAGLAAYLFSIPELRSNWHDDTSSDDIKSFMIKNAEVRNNDPFEENKDYPSKPDAASLKVPYNLALNQLCDVSDGAVTRSVFNKRALDPYKSVPGRPIVEDGAITDNDAKDKLCNVHNSAD